MKKIALLCAICILLTVLPGTVGAASDVTVKVTDVENDIITISGSAPVDRPVNITILNPGYDKGDILTVPGAIQHMKSVFGKNGQFSCSVKMNTGTAPNKKEGSFTVLVSADGNLIYSNDNFVFYSNDTKVNYINEIKTATKSELLEEVEDGKLCLQKIYEVFSLSAHQLYGASDTNTLAGVITSQNVREGISGPADAEAFLLKALVLGAFECGSNLLKDKDGLKYAEIWADDNGSVSTLYSDTFKNNLNDKGKTAIVNSMLSANYKGAQFDKPFKVFEEAMYYNLIMNNILMGVGHIEEYLLTTYNTEYKALGFDTEALEDIKDEEEKINKLEKVLACGATDLNALKNSFNKIINEKENNKNNNSGGLSPSTGSSGGGGGGGGASAPKPVQTPTPTQGPSNTPEPTSAPEVSACPFTDMSGADWAKEAVWYLYGEGIINGRSETSFAPADNVTRAEFTKMILPLIPEKTPEIEKTENDKIIKVACIGDSLTQGFIGEDGKYQSDTSYTDILQELLGDGFEVKNFGRSAHGIYAEHQYSYTKTDEYKNSLAYEPDIVISVFGSNDMREVYWQDIKGDYTSIYVDFIKTYMELPSSPEVIIGLPGPVYDGEYIASRPEANQIETKQAILKAAEVLGVKVADTYKALLDLGGDALPDGLHFNKDGARTFANEIFDTIKNDAEKQPEADVSFTDVSESNWYFQSVSKAASAGIVNGDGGMFRPNDNITREDAALIIFRALGLDGGSEITFTDAGSISGYAKDAVAAMVKGGLINGMGDGTFAPKNTLTRAQAAQLIYNAIKGGATK